MSDAYKNMTLTDLLQRIIVLLEKLEKEKTETDAQESIGSEYHYVKAGDFIVPRDQSRMEDGNIPIIEPPTHCDVDNTSYAVFIRYNMISDERMRFEMPGFTINSTWFWNECDSVSVEMFPVLNAPYFEVLKIELFSAKYGENAVAVFEYLIDKKFTKNTIMITNNRDGFTLLPGYD
jgi:hypothetical protein